MSDLAEIKEQLETMERYIAKDSRIIPQEIIDQVKYGRILIDIIEGQTEDFRKIITYIDKPMWDHQTWMSDIAQKHEIKAVAQHGIALTKQSEVK